MQEIDLQLDTDNELMFKVTVEGTSPARPTCRLMIKGTEMSHSFDGHIDEFGEVAVTIPPMNRMLKEGAYPADLEIIVDDRVFVPLSFDINFEQSLRVTAESVTRSKRKGPRVSSAAIITSSGPSRRSKKAQSPEPSAEKIITVKESTRVKSKKDKDINNMSESELKDLIKSLIFK